MGNVVKIQMKSNAANTNAKLCMVNLGQPCQNLCTKKNVPYTQVVIDMFTLSGLFNSFILLQ